MEKTEARRRVVLVPASPQGHLTPMMQLGKALDSKGFSVTVVQEEYNRVSSYLQHYPSFQFVTIPESLPESEIKRLGVYEYVLRVNKANETSFKNCIAQLLQQQSNTDITCIIYDEFMYFAGAVAKDFKLPSVIFNTQSAMTQASRNFLNKLDADKYLVDMKDPKMQDKVVENLYPLRYKHLHPSRFGPLLEPFLKFRRKIADKQAASAVIINTASCLEISFMSWLKQDLEIPVYPVGPLHITASAPCSLLEEDKSCIEWLNKQKPKSVIYVSLGSLAQMETKEVLEMAWGLSNSKQPFLWVIRPGSIAGSDWIESLPEEVREMVKERGYIVKWAPQKDVLAHPAVGGFWSHCGWNSTLESIVEGVPMICRPFNGEQMINALNLESIWSVGFQLESELERGGVERAVKRLVVDEDGACMRERALVLKEKLKASVISGGFSYNALDEFVKNLKMNFMYC